MKSNLIHEYSEAIFREHIKDIDDIIPEQFNKTLPKFINGYHPLLHPEAEGVANSYCNDSIEKPSPCEDLGDSYQLLCNLCKDHGFDIDNGLKEFVYSLNERAKTTVNDSKCIMDNILGENTYDSYEKSGFPNIPGYFPMNEEYCGDKID